VSAVAVRGDAAEVALGEAQAVLAMVQDEERRGRLADLVAALADGSVDGDDAESLEELLELGLQTGRLRSLYGPAGEQAALRLYRQLPRGRELGRSAHEVTEALAAFEGRPLERVSIGAVGPGEFVLDLAAGGLELSVRLGRVGVRVHGMGA
jgi:hypothetical protein